MKQEGISKNRVKREQNREQRKAQTAKRREAEEAAAMVEANMREAAQKAATARAAAIKAAETEEKQKPEPAQKPKLVRRVADDVKRRKLKPDHKEQRISYVSLWEFVQMNGSTRTNTKGQPSERDYTLITRHIYFKKFVVGIEIPKDAQVKHVRGYPESPEHWEVMLGDAFLYSDISLKPVPGEWLNGQIEVKVKRVLKPNERIKEAVYVYANMYPVQHGQVPDHEAVFSSDDDTRTPGLHFGPSSGRYGTFLHLYPIDEE